jgi:hypothetical protein
MYGGPGGPRLAGRVLFLVACYFAHVPWPAANRLRAIFLVSPLATATVTAPSLAITRRRTAIFTYPLWLSYDRSVRPTASPLFHNTSVAGGFLFVVTWT